MSRADPQFQLRMPIDLRDEIKVAAYRNGRSMNAEILARIEGTQDAYDEARVTLRLPERLHALAKAEARANGRSLNAEIVARIEGGGAGQSMRDRFAGQALVGLLTSSPDADCGFDGYARDAYRLADAMLVARKRDPREVES